MRYSIEIPEVHKAIIDVNMPSGSTKEEIIEKAREVFEENGSDVLEYSRTLADDEYTWTITEVDDKGRIKRFIE